MSSPTEYQVFKAILEGLEFSLTGDSLFSFVENSTGCNLELFEIVYSQVQEAWVS